MILINEFQPLKPYNILGSRSTLNMKRLKRVLLQKH